MTISHACRHIIEDLDHNDLHRHFTGKGVQSWLLCAACHQNVLSDVTVQLHELNADTLGRLLKYYYFETISGLPHFAQRPLEAIGPSSIIHLDGPRLSRIAAMPDQRWLGYTEEGALEILTIDSAQPTRQIVTHYRDDRTDRPLRPIIDPTGRFVALVQDFGRFGAVIDLQTGQRTMALDAGAYHSEQVPFSACFVVHDGAPVLIHRTDWNRLDASDPMTGKLLTSRGPTSYRKGEQRPSHYLDYFHGPLHLSPSGRFILDDGWVWQPFGVISTFEVRQWLSTNVWETEDGSSLKTFPHTYEMERGVAWLSDEQIVVEHRCELAPPENTKVGFLVDSSGKEIRPVAGLAGRFFHHPSRLFTVDLDGLAIWDTNDWARIGFLPGFRPTVQHRQRQELAQLDGDKLVTWRYLT